MAYERKPNSGTAFHNRRKERDSHADLSGEALMEHKCSSCGHMDSVSYWVSFWVRKDKNGNDWFSFLLKAKEPPQPKPPEEAKTATEINIDDEIQF